jgi:molybdopterin synthase catalytic subunit
MGMNYNIFNIYNLLLSIWGMNNWTDGFFNEPNRRIKMKPFEIVETEIDAQKYVDYVQHPGAGAITVFTGNVREWTHGVRTMYLAYEAYIPMAEKMLREIGAEMESKWPGVKAAIVHRIGELQVSEVAVLIAVSSPHRKSAYEANEYAIERIKEYVPIWKKEIWEDGEEWIGGQKKYPSKGDSTK